MSKWSKLPPRQAGLFWFRGARTTRNNQRVALNEPVRLQWIPNGKGKDLAAIMFGTQRKYSLSMFDGEWRAIGEEALPADIKRTFEGALRVEMEEYGGSAELTNARLWLEGKLGAEHVR